MQGSVMGDMGITLLGQVCSIVFLCLGGFKQSSWQGDIEEITLNFFATMIGSEITLRLFAMHPSRYFNSGTVHQTSTIPPINEAYITHQQAQYHKPNLTHSHGPYIAQTNRSLNPRPKP